MSDSTSILDLPTDPVGGGNVSNNITMSATESIAQKQGQSNAGLSLDQSTISQIVSGLQHASISGATQLPSRDIPMTTSNMMNDAQIKPNFIPNPQAQVQAQGQNVNQYGPRPMPSNNYIEEHEQDMTSEEKYRKSQNDNSNAENIYKLMQIPVIVGILYFVFQLPVMRKYVLKFIPSVFNPDGNYNISGLIFMSSLFAASFFGLSKVLEMSESW
jgi:hypothetical protein